MTATSWKWRLIGLGGVVVLALIVLHAYLNSGSVRSSVLSRLKKDLTTQLGDVEVGDRFSVDWVGRVRVGPIALLDAGQPFVTADSVMVRPAYHRLLIGRVEPAALVFESVAIDLDRAKEGVAHLQNRRQELRAPNQVRQESPLEIDIRATDIHFRTARAQLQKLLEILSPMSGKLILRRAAGDRTMSGNFEFRPGGTASVDLQMNSDRTVSLRLRGAVPNIHQVSKRLEDLPFTVKAGELHLEATLETEQSFRHATLACSARLQSLQLEGERLDSRTVGPMDVEGAATATWADEAKRLQLVKAEAGISGYAPLPLGVTGRLDLKREPYVDIDVAIQKLDFQKLLHALPAQLSPRNELPSMDGVVSAKFGLKGPLAQPEKLELNAKLDLTGLHPAQSSLVPLLSSFEYHPGENGQRSVVLVGDKNPEFVPLERIPPLLVSAVTLSEDAGFWGHRGFDFQEIKGTLLDAVEEKRFRGASTISQQLAKNLYFSREKTFARKIKEAIATITLEASLPKSRILEIYLNIIEWGPGIYGIGPAAKHYFECDVGELTPKQAAFLASIIPNPIKYHVYYRQGALSEVWEKRVHDLLVKMRDTGVLSEAELIEAEQTPIVFAQSKDPKN
jgi:hypothetical protein